MNYLQIRTPTFAVTCYIAFIIFIFTQFSHVDFLRRRRDAPAFSNLISIYIESTVTFAYDVTPVPGSDVKTASLGLHF